MTGNYPTVIGFWESRGGKYWLALLLNPDGTYSYRETGGGGYLAHCTEQEAFAKAEQQISFWPSKAHYKQPAPHTSWRAPDDRITWIWD